jgi:primosomal protein N' (replication factor Y) (superfamily II helicase)
MHSGEVDVLVGTQMIAKGHDFRRITLVASVNTDGGLFASDYRAPSACSPAAAGRRPGRARCRLCGPAGQRQVEALGADLVPAAPPVQGAGAHDYPAFAAQQLQERQAAQMPPFAYQALVRAEARTQEAAQAC